jgi:hypothetical protein
VIKKIVSGIFECTDFRSRLLDYVLVFRDSINDLIILRFDRFVVELVRYLITSISTTITTSRSNEVSCVFFYQPIEHYGFHPGYGKQF